MHYLELLKDELESKQDLEYQNNANTFGSEQKNLTIFTPSTKELVLQVDY